MEQPQQSARQQDKLQQLLCLKVTRGINLGKRLGDGRYGSVFEATLEEDHWPMSLLETKLVVKVPKDDFINGQGGRPSRSRIYEEFILGSISHPSIVSCLAFLQSPPFWALFERCNRGTLWDALRGTKIPPSTRNMRERIREEGVTLVL
jgi:serine/threonine protein kinase